MRGDPEEAGGLGGQAAGLAGREGVEAQEDNLWAGWEEEEREQWQRVCEEERWRGLAQEEEGAGDDL